MQELRSMSLPISLSNTSTNVLRVPVLAANICLALIDALLIALGYAVSELIYVGTILQPGQPTTTVALGVGMAAVFVTQLAFCDAYSMRSIRDFRGQFRIALRAWVLTFFVIGWIAFLTQTTASASRLSVMLFFVIGFGVLWGGRTLAALLTLRAIAAGRLVVRTAFVIAIGTPEDRTRMVEEERRAGVEVIGQADVERAEIYGSQDFDHLQQAVERAKETLTHTHFDAIHIHMHWRATYAIAQLRTMLSQTPVPAFLFADPFIDPIVRARRHDTGHNIGFELRRAPLNWFERTLKRSFDLVVATTLLMAFAPLLAFIALAILLETGRPIFFRQRRKGFGGRPFAVYKFRSMTVAEDGDIIKQAERRDPRVTRLGAILRRLSLDELPQLLNVIQGHMSLVGPRPHALAHDNHYDKEIATYAHRQHVKPGITGWAQVNGYRGETRDVLAMIGRVDHDLHYINNWSFWLDLKILAMTAMTLAFDEKAY